MTNEEENGAGRPPSEDLESFSPSAYSRRPSSRQIEGHTGQYSEGVQEVPSTGVTSPGDLARETQDIANGLLAPGLHVVE